MKEFVDKLIEKLTKIKGYYGYYGSEECEYVPYDYSISIIKELEKEYNNGWIPCSEKLPNKEGYYIVTRKSGEVDIGLFTFWANGGKFNSYDDLCRFPDEKIIAWQPLPPAYKKGK